MRASILLIAALFAAAAAGCDKPKQSECDALISQVNTDLEDIDKRDPAAAKSEAEAIQTLNNLASRYEQLSEKVAGLTLVTAELKTHAASYQKLAQEAAATSRRLADAIQQKDASEQKAAEQEFERIAKQQKELVAKINTFCGR